MFGNHENYRHTFSTPEVKGRYELDIIADENLIEIFVNDGEYVLSNVVYGLKHEITGSVTQILAGRD